MNHCTLFHNCFQTKNRQVLWCQVISTRTPFDYNDQNAFRCNLCYADLCHARAILHKRKSAQCDSLP